MAAALEPAGPAATAAAAAAAPLLEVRDLHAWYGESHVLHGVSFEVGEGEVVTLLGRNGAGKTTTLRSVMGIVRRREGSVRLAGRELVGLPSNHVARAGVALCPEERGIFASLDVRENLMLPPQVRPGGMGLVSSTSSRTSRSGSAARARSSRAASSRCWRSPASCARGPASSCSTSPPRAWRP
jgi:ABC-type sugar transport system ATPase subunit